MGLRAQTGTRNFCVVSLPHPSTREELSISTLYLYDSDSLNPFPPNPESMAEHLYVQLHISYARNDKAETQPKGQPAEDVTLIALLGHFAQAFRCSEVRSLFYTLGVESGSRQPKSDDQPLGAIDWFCSPCFGAARSTSHMHRLRSERGERSVAAQPCLGGWCCIGGRGRKVASAWLSKMKLRSGCPRRSAGLEGCHPRHLCSVP